MYKIKTNITVNKPELNMKRIQGVMTINEGTCMTVYNNKTFTKMVFSSMKQAGQKCSLIRTTHDNFMILEYYNYMTDEEIKDKTIKDINNMKETEKGIKNLTLEVEKI